MSIGFLIKQTRRRTVDVQYIGPGPNADDITEIIVSDSLEDVEHTYSTTEFATEVIGMFDKAVAVPVGQMGDMLPIRIESGGKNIDFEVIEVNTGFLIKMTHHTGESVSYIGAVQTGDERTPFEPIARTLDFEAKILYSLEEARQYTFSNADSAVAVIGLLPETFNLDFEVIEVEDK